MYKNSVKFRNCEICNKKYKIKPRQVAHQKYCSNRCYLDRKKQIYWENKNKIDRSHKLYKLLGYE